MSNRPPTVTDVTEDNTLPFLQIIEQRTAHLHQQARFAMGILFPEEAAPADGDLTLKIIDLYAPNWEAFIPRHPKLQAILTHMLIQKYPPPRKGTPRLRSSLQWDNTLVQDAYSKTYGQPLPEMLVDSAVALTQLDLSEEELGLRDLENELEWVALKRGETLFQEGDKGDSLFVVVSGQVEVSVGGAAVGVQGRGGVIGEMAVLTNEPRAATVKAQRDASLIKLSGYAFRQMVEKHPRIMLNMSRFIIARLRDTLQQGRMAHSALTNIALLPLSTGVPMNEFAERLSGALGRYGKVRLLASSRLDAELGEGSLHDLGHRESQRRIVSILDEKEADFRFVIYMCDADESAWTKVCLQQADRLLLVAGRDDSPALTPLENKLLAQDNTTRQELVILHPDRNHPPQATKAWLTGRKIDRHYHVALHWAADLERLARRLTHKAVGLALGAGGARGFGHIGVLRACDELGIPVDLVGGTSVGAMIGGLYACGYPFDEMPKLYGRVYDRVRDFTFPMLSLLRGHKIMNTYIGIFGERLIEDLWVEFFCMSANLTAAGSKIHQTGEVWKAVRASGGVPGVFPPVLDENGDLLVDGGVFDMVPAGVMSRLCEGGAVISVELTEGVSMRHDYNFTPDQSGWSLLRQRLFRGKGVAAPSIVEILARATMVTMDENRLANRRYSSIHLSLPLADYPILEMKEPQKVEQIGYETAMRQLGAWKTSQIQ